MFFSLTLLFFLSFFIDEKLDPRIEAILVEEAPKSIPDSQNGYFAWLGVRGPKNENPHDWGKRLFSQVLQVDKNHLETEGNAEIALQAHLRPDLDWGDEALCEWADKCLQTVATDAESAESALRSGQITLDRMGAVMRYPSFQEAWRPDNAWGPHLPVAAMEWNRLARIRFALKASRGLHDEAMADMEREVSFHIRQLQGGYSLPNQLLGMVSLLSRYHLLNQYMLQYPEAAKRRAAKMANMLAPLPANAFSLKAAVSNEIRQGVLLLRRINMKAENGLVARVKSIFFRQQYLPNATANMVFRNHLSWLAAEAEAGPDYRKKALETLRLAITEGNEVSFSSRNRIGHIVANIARPHHLSVFLDRDSILAWRALVSFQLDLLRSGTEQSESIAAAVEVASLDHPFTGGKAKWNVQKRTLGYSDLPDGSEWFISL